MSKDRVFLDANVLFSIAYGSRGLMEFWERQRAGRLTLLASPYVIEEARRNLREPRQQPQLQSLLAELEIVPDSAGGPLPGEGLAAKDSPVIWAAVVAHATHLVTGDQRHFGPYMGASILGVRICSPASYLSGP